MSKSTKKIVAKRKGRSIRFDFWQYLIIITFIISRSYCIYTRQFSVDKQFPQLSETIFALLLSTIYFGVSVVSPSVCVILWQQQSTWHGRRSQFYCCHGLCNIWKGPRTKYWWSMEMSSRNLLQWLFNQSKNVFFRRRYKLCSYILQPKEIENIYI